MYLEIIDFIRDQFKTNEFIPLHVPTFIGNEKKYVTETIESTFVSSVGKFVDRFEKELANYTGSKRSVAVVNGTSALQVALRIAGVRRDTEVITQALSFVATANAISYLCAHPIFVDVDKDTMGMSPSALSSFLEEYIEIKDDKAVNRKSGKVISACVPMHTFGFPCDIDGIVSICKEFNIPVIEDAAESLGSKVGDIHTGNFGVMGTLSYNGNKTITCGGGGSILVNDDSIADHAKYLTTTAKKPHKWDYFHDELGYNFRMPNLNAALACAQLEKLDLFLNNKRKLASRYESYFAEKGIKFRTENQGTTANYWLMAIELENRKERDQFLESTNKEGVMTRPIWVPLCDLPMYKDCQRDALENTRYFEDRIVNIPSSFRQ